MISFKNSTFDFFFPLCFTLSYKHIQMFYCFEVAEAKGNLSFFLCLCLKTKDSCLSVQSLT